MRVRVMYRNSYYGGDGWTYYPVVIDIADKCPVCGENRGEPRNHRFFENGDWYDVDKWQNPCGHADSYKNCLIEAFNSAKDIKNVKASVEVHNKRSRGDFKHNTKSKRQNKTSEMQPGLKIDNSGWLQQTLF